MSLKKRLLAACAALIMTFSLAGCSNKTSYIMKGDGEELASGVYISLMLTEHTNQYYSAAYSGKPLDGDFKKQTVGDKLMSKYLEEYAYDTCLDIMAVEKLSKKLKLTLTDDEKSEINDAVNSSWDTEGDYYEEMGISKASLKKIQEYSYYSDKLFDAYYLEGGVEEVSDEELTKYVNENILRYKMIYIPIEEDDKDAAKKMSEKYMGYAEEGKTMDELIEMYEEETSEEETTDEETNEDTSADTDKDTETDEKTEAETDAETDVDTSTESEDGSESSEDEDEVTDEEIESDAELEEEEKTPAEIESEKYPNEYVRDKSSFDGDEMIDFIDGLEYKKISSHSDDEGYYIIEKLDIAERTEFAKANKEGLIGNMKSDDFEALLKATVDAMKIEKNEESLKRYNAIDVYERSQEWIEENKEDDNQ